MNTAMTVMTWMTHIPKGVLAQFPSVASKLPEEEEGEADDERGEVGKMHHLPSFADREALAEGDDYRRQREHINGNEQRDERKCEVGPLGRHCTMLGEPRSRVNSAPR